MHGFSVLMRLPRSLPSFRTRSLANLNSSAIFPSWDRRCSTPFRDIEPSLPPEIPPALFIVSSLRTRSRLPTSATVPDKPACGSFRGKDRHKRALRVGRMSADKLSEKIQDVLNRGRLHCHLRGWQGQELFPHCHQACKRRPEKEKRPRLRDRSNSRLHGCCADIDPWIRRTSRQWRGRVTRIRIDTQR